MMQLKTGTDYPQLELKGLKQLFQSISRDYCDIIVALCRSFQTDTDNLEKLAHYHEYTNICRSLLDKVQGYLAFRDDALARYVNELHEKREAGHNCLHCTGKCHVQHQLQIADAIYTIREIKQSLCSIFECFPIPDNIKIDTHYKNQRLSLMRLDNALTEMMYMEEVYLMPAILKTQIEINAHH